MKKVKSTTEKKQKDWKFMSTKEKKQKDLKVVEDDIEEIKEPSTITNIPPQHGEGVEGIRR